MSDDKSAFDDTVKNLLNMRPKPHDEAKEPKKKDGDEQTRRRPASRSDQSD